MLVDALRRRVRTRSDVCRAERLDWLMAGGPWVARVENDGESGGGPTVRRMLLGAQLRRLREAKGVSREEAGYLIRGSVGSPAFSGQLLSYLIYAASCRFRYSLRTSRGVL